MFKQRGAHADHSGRRPLSPAALGVLQGHLAAAAIPHQVNPPAVQPVELEGMIDHGFHQLRVPAILDLRHLRGDHDQGQPAIPRALVDRGQHRQLEQLLLRLGVGQKKQQRRRWPILTVGARQVLVIGERRLRILIPQG